MPVLKKLNPNSKDTHFGFTKSESGCCNDSTVCGYQGVGATGDTFEAVTFIDSEGATVVHTFETPATTADEIYAAISTAISTVECEGGMGAQVCDGGLSVTDDGTDVTVELISDVEIVSLTVAGVEVLTTKDCTSVKICKCQAYVAVDADVAATPIQLSLDDPASFLATGVYATGDAAVLMADWELVLVDLGIDFTEVVVTENTKEGLFTVSISIVGDCGSVLYNCSALSNCGCSKSYLYPTV